MTSPYDLALAGLGIGVLIVMLIYALGTIRLTGTHRIITGPSRRQRRGGEA